LVLYLVFVQRPKEEAAQNATPTAASGGPLWGFTVADVTGARVVDNAGGRTLIVNKDDSGAWAVLQPTPAPADQVKATDVINRLAGLRYTTTLSPTNLADFGVLSPTYRIELTTADGVAHLIDVGNKAPVGTGHYVRRPGDTLILVVSGLDALEQMLADPPYVPTATPTLTATVDLVATLLAPTPTLSTTVTPALSATLPPPAASATLSATVTASP
jgi:hypothetical protein